MPIPRNSALLNLLIFPTLLLHFGRFVPELRNVPSTNRE